MVASGMKNEEISIALSLHRRTVDTHRQNLLNRFGVNNTASLITAAHKLGYI
jgi:DNA-binding CsgD family transcriptional regulator